MKIVVVVLVLCGHSLGMNLYNYKTDTLARCIHTETPYNNTHHISPECKMELSLSAANLKQRLNFTDGQTNYIWSLVRESEKRLVDRKRKRRQAAAPLLTVRRECRIMTASQRGDLFYAINYLKRRTGTPSFYDTLASFHGAPEVAAHAHGGSNFKGWHRIYLLYFEIALQRVRRNAALCYWDTTFEFRLGRENWAWTSAFSDEMFGNAFGEVTSGPFRDWLLPAPNTNRILQRRLLDREVDRTGNRGSPVDPRAVEAMFLNPQLNTISSVTVGGTGGIFLTNRLNERRRVTIEGEHNNVHVMVGEVMANVAIAPFDPVFYFHHCYVDYLWEGFRQKLRLMNRPATEYPAHGPASQGANARMIPFSWIRNYQGYSDLFTEHFYTYEPSPSCQACRGARLLDCNGNGQCVATTRPRIGGRNTFVPPTPLTYRGPSFASTSNSD